jgi:assimilatory nitrate reductase catalytic subunit
VLVRALVSGRQREGSVFVPMHWTDQYASCARIDRLVPPITDPTSGQPAAKHVPIRIERFAAATYGFAVLTGKPDRIDADYWAIARCQGGWRVELAFADTDRDWASFAEALFAAPGTSETLSYVDISGGQRRFACFEGDRLHGALFLAREPVPVPRSWLVEQLVQAHDGRRPRLAVIAGRPSRGAANRGATICSCFAVGSNQIAEAVGAGCRTVEAVGQATQAGTNCGSCRAEIRAIIESHRLEAAE